jgi:hypothetical protein
VCVGGGGKKKETTRERIWRENKTQQNDAAAAAAKGDKVSCDECEVRVCRLSSLCQKTL